MPDQPKYPLVRYLRVESAYTRQIKSVLEAAAADVERRLTKLGSGGNPLTRAQYLAQKSAIREYLKQPWSDIQSSIALGQRAAASEAVKTIGVYEKELLASLGSTEYYDDVVRAEAARAASGVNQLMARYTSSYKPLSERVYRAGVIGNGAIDKAINVALVQNLSARDFAQSIRKLISPSTPGGVSYAALRTARTEINNASHAASQQRYRDSKLVEAVDWHLSTSHPEGDECDSYASDSPYLPTEVPEKPHPQCLCYTTPSLPSAKDFLQNLLNGDYGDEPWADDATVEALRSSGPTPPKVSIRQVLDAKSDPKLLSSVYEGKDFNGFNLKFEYVEGNYNATQAKFAAKIIDSAGKNVGNVERTFLVAKDGTLQVTHDLMQLEREARGKGFSSAFSAYSEAWYKQAGVTQINVHAALSDGGYAWARAGYGWSPVRYRIEDGEAINKPQSVIDQVDRLIAADADPFTNDFNKLGEKNVELLQSYKARFASEDYREWPTPSEMAGGGFEPVRGYNDTLATGKRGTLGKKLMTGTDWHGVKPL